MTITMTDESEAGPVDPYELPLSKEDKLLQRAFRSAVFGAGLLGILTIYSMLILRQVDKLDGQLTKEQSLKWNVTFFVNTLIISLWLLGIAALFLAGNKR